MRATPQDVDRICAELPETWFSTSWGDVPTWLVPHRDKGRGFVLYRKPHRSAIDPATGEEYDDLLVVRTADMESVQELVQADGPFFTIDHFSGYRAVLVQLSRLGELDVEELREVLTDAWLACVSPKLAREFLAGRE